MSDDITLPALSKSESWNLTDEIRQGYETIHESRVAQAERLARAYEGRAWESMGYETFDEYHGEEFGDDLKHQRLELEERISAVKVLADSGMAKAKIAEILGVSRMTVHRDLASQNDLVTNVTSTEVDAAGQSVEEVGHIEDDEPQPQIVLFQTPTVIEKVEEVSEPNNEEKEMLDEFVDRFAGIDFGNMVTQQPMTQIIETTPSQDTSDYFVPRSPSPSWSPPQVTELPPPSRKAYHEQPDTDAEFLEPPLKLQKVGEDKKEPADKHCRTCACNLLP